jgi:lipoate-protein ligase A
VSWRLLTHENLSAAHGLAVDEGLATAMDDLDSPPTLHLYTFRSAVIVGRYQNVQSAVRIAECEARGVEFNRRHTGGGTVLMTPSQLAIAFAIGDRHVKLPTTIRSLFHLFAKILSDALRRFGLTADFVGKNDLQIKGKKVAGLAISQDQDKATFFHASLLLDFDVALMLELLNLPTQRLPDKGISCFGERITTLRQEGIAVPVDDVIQAVVGAFEQSFTVPLEQIPLSRSEQLLVQRLVNEKYTRDSWIYLTRLPRKRHYYAERLTPGGLLQVHLSVAGGTIENILITGNYFSRSRDLCRLESVLKWSPLERSVLTRTIRDHGLDETIYRIKLDTLVDAILSAANSHLRPLIRPASPIV